MSNTAVILMIAVSALVTIVLRFIPFIIFHDKTTPKLIIHLGKVLPYAIMGMLVVFCLKGVKITESPHGIPKLISCLVVIGLHVWKRNTLLSIICGTVCYMILVQMVFV